MTARAAAYLDSPLEGRRLDPPLDALRGGPSMDGVRNEILRIARADLSVAVRELRIQRAATPAI